MAGNTVEKTNRLKKAMAVDELVTAIEDYVEEAVRSAATSDPYYSGQKYQSSDTLRVKLMALVETL
jgi:hypothetical protein